MLKKPEKYDTTFGNRHLGGTDWCEMATFKFPAFHAFPPSFTLQPVPATRAKQTQLWCDLIRAYCRFHHIFWLDTASAAAKELFRNDAISRSLSDADVKYFLGELVLRGDGEWDAARTRCLVYWRRPGEWADLIFKWVEDTGQNGQVLTVHEIRKSTASKGQGKFSCAFCALEASIASRSDTVATVHCRDLVYFLLLLTRVPRPGDRYHHARTAGS